MRNLYFSHGVKSEQHLYEDLVIESLKIYGHEMYYMPRDIVKNDTLFFEDPSSRFNSSYAIEMYVDNVEGWDGEGDLFSKFGVEIRDAVTLTVSRRRWKHAVKRHDNEITFDRPMEGDLIYAPFANKLFEIMHVEHEQPFYQLKNLPIYKLRCELFSYNNEEFDTGNEDIDIIQRTDEQFKYALVLSSPVPTELTGENITLYQYIDSDTYISFEAITWEYPTSTLYVNNLGHNDATTDFKEPIVGNNIYNSLDSDQVNVGTLVSFTISNDSRAQNEIISGEVINFLDFSESNPFGDPE